MNQDTEVMIIGAGVLGAATARELSKYAVDVTLVDKRVDFARARIRSSFARNISAASCCGRACP